MLVHARALLTSTGEGRTAYIDADVHDPEAILRKAEDTLDLTQPGAVMMLGTLNLILDTDEAHPRRPPRAVNRPWWRSTVPSAASRDRSGDHVLTPAVAADANGFRPLLGLTLPHRAVGTGWPTPAALVGVHGE